MNRPYNSPASSPKARPSLAVRTCKHIMKSGAFCQGVAQRGSAYCHAHLEVQERSRRMARARRRSGILKLPILEDMQALQVASARVQVALEAGHIDESRARLVRWGPAHDGHQFSLHGKNAGEGGDSYQYGTGT